MQEVFLGVSGVLASARTGGVSGDICISPKLANVKDLVWGRAANDCCVRSISPGRLLQHSTLLLHSIPLRSSPFPGPSIRGKQPLGSVVCPGRAC